MATAPAPQIFAHRGKHPLFKENTLGAIRAAAADGVDGIELDVQLLADGNVVSHHDDTLARLWADPRPISALTLPELRQLTGATEGIPTLAEVIELGAELGVELILDQKHPIAGLASWREVQRVGRGEVSFCGSLEGLYEIRSVDPAAKIYANQVTDPNLDLRMFALLRPQYFNPWWQMLSPLTVKTLHGFGINVCCWTPNTESDLNLVFDLGVDAVMTDNHELALRLRAQRN